MAIKTNSLAYQDGVQKSHRHYTEVLAKSNLQSDTERHREERTHKEQV